MYLLEWVEGDRNQYVGIFESVESGRAFMQKVPGYRRREMEIEDFIIKEEIIEYDKLPDIAMIEHNGYRVPISRFSFEEDIRVTWVELDHLDQNPAKPLEKENSELRNPPVNKVAVGATRIDAYSINNEEVEQYVTKRESQYNKCVEFLDKEGFEVSRGCFGSEDGEIIFIRKKGSHQSPDQGWHFLTHMDPFFVEMDVEKELPEMLEESW